MKKIMFSGLLPDVTEEAVRKSLEKVGPVHTVSIIKDGDASAPLEGMIAATPRGLRTHARMNRTMSANDMAATHRGKGVED